ncbi:L-rhamnose mutarotase [Cellulophaga sp. E16_2]|uniref:L-rhamnose mutarotase n=1 Tax=unclassified Cellulophaga TaxID=2634405 RepID=UPI0013FD4AB3|nr:MULTISPECIES: L-rhamnose mutarotase [unclassified Cellulophaga]MBO0590260.1 L-rhamnose mutarotase [Cellulophaga sp. E16_2]
MKRYCFALDLTDDPMLIAAYKKHHTKVWPEIMESIKASAVDHLEIYLVENRLFMIMETSAEFSFDVKNKADLNNPKVQEWEKLMWNYQQALPNSKKGEKWRLMEQIFEL